MGPHLYVWVSNPKDVEVVLSGQKNLDKFDDYRFFHEWLGRGLVTSNGSFWFRQRRLITPSFHFKNLTGYHTAMSKGANALIVKFSKMADTDKSFDIQHIVNLGTLDVICGKLCGRFSDSKICVYLYIFPNRNCDGN